MQVRYQAAPRPDETKLYQLGYPLDGCVQECNDAIERFVQGFAVVWCWQFLLGFGMPWPVFQAVSGTADGESVLIKQLANATHQQNFVVLVIASVAATLDRLELSEFLFPVTQHVGLNATQIADFANGEVAFGGNGRQV